MFGSGPACGSSPPAAEPLVTSTESRLHERARQLQFATIAWNSVEVFVTVGLGVAANSLALVAFGMDSLIEVFASLVVVWHLGTFGSVPSEERTARALRLVAIAFGALAISLLVGSARGLWTGSEADSSIVGIAYLAATAIVMFTLARWKRRVSVALDVAPLVSEASVTFLDGLLASGILVALALNTAFGWWWADPIAAAAVGVLALHEAVTGWPRAATIESG